MERIRLSKERDHWKLNRSDIILHHIIVYRVTSCHVMPRHATSCNVIFAAVLRVPTLAPAKVLVMATLIGQLPVWIGATLATWAICWTLVSPEACQDSPACAKHLKTYPGDTTLFHIFTFQDLDTRV